MSPGEAEPALPYQPFYCEENVWHACRAPRFAGRWPRAVFLSSAARAIVMWHQRAAPRLDAPVLWDYHVVLLVEAPWQVWDVDSTLGAPLDAATYLARSFPYAAPRPDDDARSWRRRIPAEMAPRFRLVEAAELVARFASDRAHMRAPSGRYKQPPPPWPPIGAPGEPSNLSRFLDVDAPFLGEVLSFDDLFKRVRSVETPG
ncbi:MAG TPA: hypothetical protein VGM56_02390 [Byssovorax sp.]|jgi:hypothetical protein